MLPPPASQGPPPRPPLWWCNLVDDTTNGVDGIAVVRRGFDAPLHRHAPAETYEFVRGVGLLWHAGRAVAVCAPYRVAIAPGDWHAMTPLTATVVLRYRFAPAAAPFATIAYEYDPAGRTLRGRAGGRDRCAAECAAAARVRMRVRMMRRPPRGGRL